MMIKIEEIFDVFYGTNLELNKLNQVRPEEGINFVSRTRSNNGISAVVERLENVEPLKAGLISVAASGNSVMETFVQPKPFYTGRDVYILRSKVEMTIKEKLFYCMCLKKNRYRFNYGRQANRTLKELLVPKEIPDWVYNIELTNYEEIDQPFNPVNKNLDLYDREWKEFVYTELFNVLKGRRVVKQKIKPGNTPFVASIDSNNGIREFCDLPPLFPGNVITVNYNGSVGESFYQSDPFWASDDVNVLVPKFELNPYIAMFLITIIKKEKYRFNYGRKWHKERMENSIIKLPINTKGIPDWNFMDVYIKTLPYSKMIAEEGQMELNF
ncbi:restriction endonuclease subunit S [Bacillus gobiensis]|uniref:restriction endonuclease subunit S n=1 Tax=Bacillus gobiensis TaxID=1441095 RepID=UPI003D2514AA